MGGALFVSGKKWSDGRGRTTVSDTRPEEARYTFVVGEEANAIEERIWSVFILWGETELSILQIEQKMVWRGILWWWMASATEAKKNEMVVTKISFFLKEVLMSPFVLVGPSY
jgi:hypothetical protein